MEQFLKSNTVCLRSSKQRYLTASDDESSVSQRKDGSARASRWSVELVDDSPGFVRLRSCVGRLLTASDRRFLLGATGRKVLQTLRNPNNASVEWEPLLDAESGRVMLRSHRGTFLRGNGGGVWPYKGSVTHDVPQLAYTHQWVLWEVDVLPPKCFSSRVLAAPASTTSSRIEWDPSSSTSSLEPSSNREEVTQEGEEEHPGEMINFERTIHYQVVDDEGKVDSRYPKGTIFFRGLSVIELTRRIEEKTGIQNATLCVGVPDVSKFNKLHPMWLTLPPNRTKMTVFVARSYSLVTDSDDM